MDSPDRIEYLLEDGLHPVQDYLRAILIVLLRIERRVVRDTAPHAGTSDHAPPSPPSPKASAPARKRKRKRTAEAA